MDIQTLDSPDEMICGDEEDYIFLWEEYAY